MRSGTKMYLESLVLEWQHAVLLRFWKKMRYEKDCKLSDRPDFSTNPGKLSQWFPDKTSAQQYQYRYLRN